MISSHSMKDETILYCYIACDKISQQRAIENTFEQDQLIINAD